MWERVSIVFFFVSGYADLAFVFVVGKYIFRFESNLIAGVTACSNVRCAILSPVEIWNYF